MKLDLDFVRDQYDVFKTEPGQRVAFFDNAGGSYVPRQVVNILNDFYSHYKVQPYGPTWMMKRAGENMDRGRHTMADLLNVDYNRVTIGASTTQNLNTLALACFSLIGPNGQVIISEQDHEANIGGWERVCKLAGGELKIWPVDPQSGELDLNKLKNIISDRTKIVCVTHSSNIIGSINPINEIYDVCKEHGARLVVDAVSYVPHNWPNLDELKFDAYVFSTYKTYGTHQGIMVLSEELLEEIEPQCHFFNADILYKRLDSSGPDHASIAALAGIGDYFSTLYDHHFGKDDLPLYKRAIKMSALMNEHEENLCSSLLSGFNGLPLRIYGRTSMPGREANIAFRNSDLSSSDILQGMADHNVACKHGHFYAYRLIKALGIDPDDGVVRLSLSHYNSHEEVEMCIDALRKTVDGS